MAQNNFWIGLIADLKKAQSKKQVQTDAKNLGDIKVPLIGTLNKARTKAQLKQDLASMNGTVNLTGKMNKKGTVTSVQQATQQAQATANKVPIQVSMNLKKDKLINDINIFGQQNTKLFKDENMTAKYNSLLDSAKLASSGKEIQNLRMQLSAMRSELKANNLAGLTLGDTFKKTFKRATELFTGTGGIMLLTRQLHDTWEEALTLDKAYTDLIKVQNELSRSDYPDYLDRCNEKAQKLATTQKALIESTTEFSKSGYNLTESDALAEKATMLSNVGDMSASDSAKAIISGVQAYDVVDGYDDAINKAEALIDKYNEIGNTASITTAEIAQGVQSVGSVFADANTSVDEFIALLAAGNRQYQDADALALGLRTSALRIRGCTAELELMGEETETVVTSTAKLEAKIKALTNINGSGGVEIIEADGETLRSIYDIYVDIAKVYQDMSDTDQSALLELIAGKHRASVISATLNNMSEAQEIYQRSLESSGSAQAEYDKYLSSSEASLNQFKATMTETYQSVLDGSTVKSILDCGNATLQFVNSLGLVESTLKGFVAIGIVKVITTLSTAFKASAIQASNFGTALNTVKDMSTMARGTTEYTNALNTLKAVSVGLSETQLKQVLASKSLSEADRIAILRTTGLTKAQAQAKLAQMGLVQSTKAQTTAQKTATASTFSLTAAVKGFGASLKAAFLSNPIGIAIMAISTAFGMVTSAIDSANQKAEESRQKAKDAANTASNLTFELTELTGKYLTLSEAVKTDKSSKEELMTTQTELLKKLGLEGESIDDLIVKYGSLSNAIKQASIDALKYSQIDLLAGINATKEELLKAGESGFWGSNIIDATGDDAVKAFKELEKAGIIDRGSFGSGGGALVLTGDDTKIEGILDNYHKLEDAVMALRSSGAFTGEELSENSLFQAIYSRYSEMKDEVDAYNSSIDNLNENLAQQTMLTALQGRELPKTEQDFETFRQELIDTAIASKEFIGSEEEVADAINDYLSSAPQFEGYYSIPLENELDKVDALLDGDNLPTLSYDTITKLAESATNSVDTLRSSIASVNEAFAEQAANGSVSVDTMLAMVDAGYATALQFDAVTGACTINREAMLALVQAKIQNQIADLQLLQSNIQQKLSDDGNTARESANGFYDLAKAKLAAASAEQLASMKQFNDAEAQITALQNAMKNINKIGSGTYSTKPKIKSSASSAKKEAKKTMEDIQKDWKEYLDKYLALYKAELDAGLIDFQTFLNKSRSLLDEFYRDGKISAKDYWDSVGNLYQQQLDVYDKVISAITKRIDKEIDGIQGIIDGLEKQNDVLQNQLDEYDGILKVVDDVYQTEIDSIKQKQDAIDDTISKLQDENDEKQRAIDLEKARYQLYRALNNRNVKLYNGKEYIYTHDREEVRDAQQNLADLELQETVAGLEKEKNALDEVIAELEKYRDLWSEISSAKQNEEYKQLAIAIWGKDYEKLILSNRISDIESFKDNYIHIQQQIEDNQGLIDSYNEKIEYYDALKQAWNAIATEREETVNREMAAQVLGATWENDILNGRMEVLNNFRNQYLATQQAIVDAAWNAANAQIAALNAIKSAESTSSQTSSSSKAPTVSGNKNTPTKKPSKPSKPNANSGGGISNLPTIEKYGSGTDNAKPGWHEVAESGNEIIRDNNGNAYIAKGRQIHLFEGGETVYSASDTRELLSGSISPLDAGIGEVVVFDHDKMRKNLQQLIPDYMNTMPSMINIPRYNVDNVRSGNPININIGDINLHEVQSVDGLAKAIIRELPGKVNQAMYRK